MDIGVPDLHGPGRADTRRGGSAEAPSHCARWWRGKRSADSCPRHGYPQLGRKGNIDALSPRSWGEECVRGIWHLGRSLNVRRCERETVTVSVPTWSCPESPASRRTWKFLLSGAAINSIRVLLHAPSQCRRRYRPWVARRRETARQIHPRALVDNKLQDKSTVANCCHIRALSACPKGLRRSPRDDARISKWQWFLIFSGFSWVFFTEPETIPSAPPNLCQTPHLFSQNESWSVSC